MEALRIIAALAGGAQLMNSEEPNAIHSSQTTAEISKFHSDVYNELSLAQVDWSKVGNSVVGDSSNNGVQWIFITN